MSTGLLLKVSVLSAHGRVLDRDCQQLIAPAHEGEVCILPRHAPLITRLKPGELSLLDGNGQTHLLYVSGGYMEVLPNQVTVLADVLQRAEDLDEQAARQARLQAQEILALSPVSRERDLARQELLRALAQLKVIADQRRLRKRGS